MDYMKSYKSWLESEYISSEDKNELISIQNNEQEIKDRFYKELEFGTGGLRGVIGIGTNRINIYNIKKTTQGLANYLMKSNPGNYSKGIAIAYDSRHYSKEFALNAALVLAGNGIKAYLFDSLKPTPELSFAVRHLNCAGGIVITASHNPPEYNGYKVYNSDGGQVTLECAHQIIGEIDNINNWSEIRYIDQSTAANSGLLETIGSEIDSEYSNAIIDFISAKKMSDNERDLCIVYTPLHGTGLMPVSKCLKGLGYTNLHIVEEQAKPDGNFPTVASPNPEEHAAFKFGIEKAKKLDADIILGTDPDTDRVGVAVRNEKGKYKVLTGNQVGSLLVDYIIKSSSDISEKSAVIKTIVTSELGANIAREKGATVFDTLTGFKFIGEQIKEFEQKGSYDFLFGYEESYGYLAGTFVRDKDAVISCCLIAAMASYYKSCKTTLSDALNDIYKKYGYYREELVTHEISGSDGQKKIELIMQRFRDAAGVFTVFKELFYIEDYFKSVVLTRNGSKKPNLKLPKSNVIKLVFNTDSWVAIRPSGTEPKLKIYYSCIGKDSDEANRELQKFKINIEKFISAE